MLYAYKSIAIITYCLVAIVQYDMKLERSVYEVLQIFGISLTDKIHLSIACSTNRIPKMSKTNMI